MSNVYELRSNHDSFSHFDEKNEDVKNILVYRYWEWANIDLNTYQPVVLELGTSNFGKRNFKMDITIAANCLLVLSEKAVECLKDLLEKTGQIIPITTDSKRKKFYGFYANKNVYDLSIVNLDKSDYRQAERGKIFHKVVLNESYPKDDYIFTVRELAMRIYATDKFKELIEKNNLGGLRFDRTVEVSD